MAGDNLVGNLTDTLRDQLGDKLDPGKLLSEGNLKKKRGAFWTCFIAALLLMALAFAGSLAYNVTKVSLLRDAIRENVVAQGIISQSDADAFVNDTLDYLTGIKTVWEPAVTVGDHRIGVPEAFKTHMASVKGWVESAKAVLLAGVAVVLLLLGRALIGTKGSAKGPFSVGGYYLGAAIPLVLIAGVGLWGYLNFDGLWSWLHHTFIPDGIFASGEEIMQLFPVGLFASYLQPVAVTFAIATGVVLLLPLLLLPLSGLLTALFGKGRATGTSARKRTATRKPAASKATTKKTTAKKTTRKTAD